jgi:hypothetical protein
MDYKIDPKKGDPFGLNSHPFWIMLKWIYTGFKIMLVLGFLMAIGMTTWFHNQLVEICRLAGVCD